MNVAILFFEIILAAIRSIVFLFFCDVLIWFFYVPDRVRDCNLNLSVYHLRTLAYNVEKQTIISLSKGIT